MVLIFDYFIYILDADRIYKLGSNQLLNICGDNYVDFSELIQKNFDFYFYRTG